jgi:hypothetical protein
LAHDGSLFNQNQMRDLGKLDIAKHTIHCLFELCRSLNVSILFVHIFVVDVAQSIKLELQLLRVYPEQNAVPFQRDAVLSPVELELRSHELSCVSHLG